MSDEKKSKKKVRKAKGSRKRTFLIILTLVFLTPFLSYALLIFVLGMLPWLVSSYVDSSEERNMSRVMMACNFSGVMPIMADLMKHKISFDDMWSTMMDPYAWLVMYGAAFFGWALLWFFPQAVYFVLDMTQNNNVNSLKAKQQNIVDEWGMQVELASKRAERNQAFSDDRRKAVSEAADA